MNLIDFDNIIIVRENRSTLVSETSVKRESSSVVYIRTVLVLPRYIRRPTKGCTMS